MKKLKWPFLILSISLFLPINSLVAGGSSYDYKKEGVSDMLIKNTSKTELSFLFTGGDTRLAQLLKPGESKSIFLPAHAGYFGKDGQEFAITTSKFGKKGQVRYGEPNTYGAPITFPEVGIVVQFKYIPEKKAEVLIK